MGAIYPDGYEVIVKPRDGSKALKITPANNPTVALRDRAILQKFGRMGGLKSAANRRARRAAEG